MLLLVDSLKLLSIVFIRDEFGFLSLLQELSLWLVLFLQVIKLSLLLHHELVHELTEGVGSLLEEAVHQVNQFLLVSLVKEVFTDLDLLTSIELGLDSSSKLDGVVLVDVLIDSVTSTALEVIKDLLVLLI